MTRKYRKQRSQNLGWLDILTTWLEFIGLIGTFLAAIYALVTWIL